MAQIHPVGDDSVGIRSRKASAAIKEEHLKILEEDDKESRKKDFRKELENRYPNHYVAFLCALALGGLSAAIIALEYLFDKNSGLFAEFKGGYWSGGFGIICGFLIELGAIQRKGTLIFWILQAVQFSFMLTIAGCVVPHALSFARYDSYCDTYDMDCYFLKKNQTRNILLITLGSVDILIKALFLLYNLYFSKFLIKKKPKENTEMNEM